MVPKNFKPESFLRKTKEEAVNEAKSLGLRIFIAGEEGKYFMKTARFDPNRLNIVILNGKVVDASIG